MVILNEVKDTFENILLFIHAFSMCLWYLFLFFGPLFALIFFEWIWILPIQLLCWGVYLTIKERQWDRMKQQNND